ncbi:MAG TPA: hypothetical protein DIW40_09575 [Halomonas sp.]|nr:hypothetical protein [Halomonas sp.]
MVARDGATKALLKADNSGPYTGPRKAFTSTVFGRETAGLAEFIASQPSNLVPKKPTMHRRAESIVY